MCAFSKIPKKNQKVNQGGKNIFYMGPNRYADSKNRIYLNSPSQITVVSEKL
jgi:hypothetical protein